MLDFNVEYCQHILRIKITEPSVFILEKLVEVTVGKNDIVKNINGGFSRNEFRGHDFLFVGDFDHILILLGEAVIVSDIELPFHCIVN